MHYLKVDSEVTSTTSGLVASNADEGYLYLKKYDNGVTNPASSQIRFSQIHFFSPKAGGDGHEILATTPKIVNVTNTNGTIPCNCNEGTVFNQIITVTKTSLAVPILIQNIPELPGFGVLVKVTVASGVTITYGGSEVLNTTTGSDYTAGTYYFSFLYLNNTIGLKLINFFKEV